MNFEFEAKRLGYPGEKEMWEDLYAKHSLSQLAARFKCSVGQIRMQVQRHAISMRRRGGPNNVKFAVDEKLVDDVCRYGVPTAAKMRGMKPQALYMRLYYQYGLSVKRLKEMHRQGATLLQFPPKSESGETQDDS